MSLSPHRLLGFAFATADLLIEVSPTGQIALAVGASEALSGAASTALMGRAWRDFIAPQDTPMVEALFDGLKEGARGGPIVVRLAAAVDGLARAASLSAFRLPENEGALSCAFTRATPNMDDQGRLHDRKSFETIALSLIETAKSTGLGLEMALVELGGLSALRERLSPEAYKTLEQRLAGVLRAQSHGGAAAADLGEDRFALVRQPGESPEILAQRLIRLMQLDPKAGVTAKAQSMSMKGEASASQLARALRYSLDTFINDGVEGAGPKSLSEAVTRSVRKTLSDVGALGDAVNNRSFKLVFQPVVNLKAGGKLHHHEVLVRFGDNASPFPMIRMAEELDLIETLDLAVVEQTLDLLAQKSDARLAVNISGRTIGSSGFIDSVRRMIVERPTARHRLMFELTESAAIDDLALADRHIQALRAEGCQVCLDDFGAGAASLAYLQQLSLDLVKIDGRYIRELQHGGRESTFIRHLVQMCGELGVRTLAEMVETPQAEDAVRRAGVDFAQGWLYGAPAETPRPPQPVAVGGAITGAATARRAGVRETWG